MWEVAAAARGGVARREVVAGARAEVDRDLEGGRLAADQDVSPADAGLVGPALRRRVPDEEPDRTGQSDRRPRAERLVRGREVFDVRCVTELEGKSGGTLLKSAGTDPNPPAATGH